MDKIKITNAKILTPYRFISNGTIIIENGIISYVGSDSIITEDYNVIDVGGNYISPGFIDIHTHGGGGYDFMDGTTDAYLEAAKKTC